ncbi:MAG TPA: hypothetical protein VHC63_06450 [Acidimicrobiales bacterium]|nr:hypothetical protein [Acidimicrobiales bacterium]
MRTTIDLPDDIHAVARGLSRDQRITMSEAVVMLIRRGLGEPGNVALGRSRRTGLPLARVGRLVTQDDVRALDD